jgi:hypothetical protein
MSYNYTLKYRTFDQLLVDVQSDFKKYQLEDLIDPQDMIKVAKKVNYELGLRIHQTKEVVLEVEKGRVRLPLDFYTLNFALMCGEHTVKQSLPQGTHIEEKIIDPVVPEYQQAPPAIETCPEPEDVDPCDPCLQCGNPCCDEPCNACTSSPASCSLNCKGGTFQLVQKVSYETRAFRTLKPIRLLQNAMDIECDCPNLYWESPFTAWIDDGWLYTNFKTGKVYLNYQGMMEDDKGNLVVLNHDMINEYYEYALKRRILENLIMDDEAVSPMKVQIIEARHRESRNNALSIVNTPNYGEMKQMWKKNRKAQFNKYYDMFSSHSYARGRYPFSGNGIFNTGGWQSK